MHTGECAPHQLREAPPPPELPPPKPPDDPPELPPPTHFSWLRKDVGYYTYAYPLSEDYFLVSYNYGPDDRDPTGYGIYLLDRWNNRDLIYRDPALSAFEPLPVRSRPTPPVVAPSSTVKASGFS